MKNASMIWCAVALSASLLASMGCALTAPEDSVSTAIRGGRVSSELVSALDQIVRTEMSSNNIPGLAVGLVTEKGLAWGAGYGVTDRRTRTPVTVDTRFPVASVTKPLTAAAVLMLAQNGVLQVDDPVQMYLPGFSPAVSASAAGTGAENQDPIITILHLLSHHAGLVRDLQKGIVGPASLDVDLVEELSSLLPADSPGSSYRYSNAGYALLGEVIERTTGTSYAEFMREAVFSPMGMERTSVGLGPSDRDDLSFAPGHDVAGLIFPRSREVPPHVRRDSAAGSVVSTVSDLSEFVAMLLGQGETPSGAVLDGGLVQRMFQPPYPLRPMDEDDYALGFKMGKLMSNPEDARHGGTLDGYSSLIALVPAERIGVVVLMNSNHAFARHHIVNQAIRLWLGLDVTAAPRYRPVDARTAARSGHYVGVGDFSLHMELDLEAGRLVLSGETLGLVREGRSVPDRFRIVKRIAGIGFPVAGAFGADAAHLDFVSVESEVIPRITLRYRSLPLEMLFRPVPRGVAESGEPATRVTGVYELSEGSRRFAAPGLSTIEVYTDEGILFATVDGVDISRMVLQESRATGLQGHVFQALGTGETFRFDGDVLSFSGLEYVMW